MGQHVIRYMYTSYKGVLCPYLTEVEDVVALRGALVGQRKVSVPTKG